MAFRPSRVYRVLGLGFGFWALGAGDTEAGSVCRGRARAVVGW